MHYEKFSDGSITCIEDIIPFTLPNGWRWSRLSSLCSDIQYGVSNSAENSGSHRLLRITDIQDGKVEWDKVPFTTLQSPEQYRLMTGDIVFARTGATVGKSFLIKELPFDSVYASYLIRIRLIGKLSRDYVYDFFNSKCYWNQITDKSVGVGQPNCNGSSLKELLIPVPPINEQELIIKSIKNLQLYSNIIESQQTDLKSLLLKCKSKILDLAIRGKLVSQDPNDEPASKLLERIRHEKEELIKAGKLKRDKRESVIFRGEDNSYYEKFGDGSIRCIDEDILFEIPKSWVWVRLKDITINRDKERMPISLRDRTKVKKIYDYYGASGIIDKIDNYIFSEKLLLIGEDGENLIARSKPLAFFADGKYWVNNHAHCIDATDKQILEFICVFINAISIEPFITGSAQPKLTQDKLNSILVPIPPEKEQSAISKKIKQLYSVLDSINFSLL